MLITFTPCIKFLIILIEMKILVPLKPQMTQKTNNTTLINCIGKHSSLTTSCATIFAVLYANYLQFVLTFWLTLEIRCCGEVYWLITHLECLNFLASDTNFNYSENLNRLKNYIINKTKKQHKKLQKKRNKITKFIEPPYKCILPRVFSSKT